MNISKAKGDEVLNVMYACYVDGGDPYNLASHALHTLDITVNHKPITLSCNWDDHIPGGRVYEQEIVTVR